MGTEISGLTWSINSTYRGTYDFFSGDTFPQPISWSPPLPEVTINITSASFSGNHGSIESTLTASVSDLRGTLIECASGVDGVNYLDPSNTNVQESQGTEYIANCH